ncbi:transposase, partial [Lentilactobacillus sp. IMAU92037]
LFFEKHPEVKAQKFWGGHLWSRSYYMSREVVEHYIDNQR